MPTTFDFVDSPVLPNTQQPVMNQQPINIPTQQSTIMDSAPDIDVGGISFSTIDDDHTNDHLLISTGAPTQEAPKRRGRPPKKDKETVNSTEIIRPENTSVQETPTLYSYYETADMLKTAMSQIDTVASEVKQELDAVRSSRTLKSKYMVMNGLVGNLSSLLETKISAIRELNNSITRSNDLDYKREKDRKAAEAGVADDRMIMDMYQAFVKNPMSVGSGMTVLGPSAISASVADGDIIRAPIVGSSNAALPQDTGYMNYVANITPEQNMMLLENNPDVKQVVVFDASTGNKWFQIMNVKTGQVIPNAPTLDPMFMEDTTLDISKGIAKNINIGETFPLIVINDNVMKEY